MQSRSVSDIRINALAGSHGLKVVSADPAEPFASWNQTATDFPRNKTVAQLFEETAAAYPGSTALVLGARRLSYTQLNRWANRLARQLRSNGVGPETMVGCCFDRSIEMIVSFLAVLKVGAAYVPLDPGYPKERLALLLEDSDPTLMLSQSSLAPEILEDNRTARLFVDQVAGVSNGDDAADDVNLEVRSAPNSLAYVMYTSGSTGRPKGVMVENRSIVRLVRNTNFCQFGPDEIFLQSAPISFDASTLEIWGPLLNGGQLVIMPPQTFSFAGLGRAIRDHAVSTLWLTAGLFSRMVDEQFDDLRGVRQLLAGGDVISAQHVRRVLREIPNCRVINGYGPTENTTFTCCFSMRHGDDIPDSVPIGRPISNTQVYILNEALAPVAIGEVGELYAAGAGLARGYLNNVEATAERFVADPFVKEPGARMYRTGDLARWRHDGVVEFLGRADAQVKILGHRIEPGEIEVALGAHQAIKQTCVVAQASGDGAKRLVAYYVATDPVPVGTLRDFLAAKLPQHMLPSMFIPVDSLPLSPNGKVDRNALSARDAVAGAADVALATSDSGATEATDLEQKIAGLWRQTLLRDRVGLDENFFDIGGDSLALVSIHAALQKVLQIDIPVMDLFEFTTIRRLARRLSNTSDAQQLNLSDLRDQGKRQRAAFGSKRKSETGTQLI
jgi:amino acid adenylation domain-containing protein